MRAWARPSEGVVLTARWRKSLSGGQAALVKARAQPRKGRRMRRLSGRPHQPNFEALMERFFPEKGDFLRAFQEMMEIRQRMEQEPIQAPLKGPFLCADLSEVWVPPEDRVPLAALGVPPGTSMSDVLPWLLKWAQAPTPGLEDPDSPESLALMLLMARLSEEEDSPS